MVNLTTIRPEPQRGPYGMHGIRLRCAYCRRLINRNADLQVAIHDHELVCRARPVLLQLWADDLERAKRQEAATR